MGITISNTSINLTVLATLLKSFDLPGASGAVPAIYNKVYSFAQGNGANQADIIWHDERTLAGSTAESLDLTAQTDAYGGTIVLTKLKALVIVASSANNGDLQVGGAASNAWQAWLDDATAYGIVKPGGALLIVAPDVNGYTVDGTHKVLKINNTGAGTGVYDIIVIGIE